MAKKQPGTAVPPALGNSGTNDSRVRSIGGIVPMVPNSVLVENEQRAAREEAQARQNTPIVQNLAKYVADCFQEARSTKENDAEERMFKSLRQRSGKYDPEVLAEIKQHGGSEIFMQISSHKSRTASAWLRDIVSGSGSEKPWGVSPTPIPDLPGDSYGAIVQVVSEQLAELQNSGVVPNDSELMELMTALRDQMYNSMHEEAEERAALMERKMEDQLQEGGWDQAISQFVDDIVVYPSAILKGPVVRNREKLVWVTGENGEYKTEVKPVLSLEIERVDPLNFYPAPHAVTIDDGYMIERHKLTRSSLNALIGAPGYDEQAVRAVLSEYGRGGLNNWLSVDAQKAELNGDTVVQSSTGNALIEALQYFGYVQGSMLIEFGMTKEQVPDPDRDYSCEVWVIGDFVIKAMLNADPLGRKPYYKTSYEEVPGSFWGNSVCDIIRDIQQVCNSTARTLVNNMAIGSGPQVVYNVDRLPGDEDLTTMYPWKTWKVSSDPFGNNSQPPVSFFQPNTMAGELMMVYEKFANLADEYSGIPRYMAGESPTGGVGRTASGISMLMGNATKSIKQVVANIDAFVIKPLIQRYYFYNMRYGDDAEMKGDVNIVARGALAVAVKDAAQVRRNEFLMTALNSPVVSAIVGQEGIAALLRETVKTLDMNPDKIVPAPEIIRARAALAAVKQQQMMMAQAQMAQQMGMAPPAALPGASPSGQTLPNGVPVTDTFSPPAQ